MNCVFFAIFFLMERFLDILNFKLGESLVSDYLLAAAVFLILLAVFSVFNKFILKWLEKLALKTKTDLDETFISIVKKLRPPFGKFSSEVQPILLMSL